MITLLLIIFKILLKSVVHALWLPSHIELEVEEYVSHHIGVTAGRYCCRSLAFIFETQSQNLFTRLNGHEIACTFDQLNKFSLVEASILTVLYGNLAHILHHYLLNKIVIFYPILLAHAFGC